MVSWKPIRDYEGRYEVSSSGLVRSIQRTVPTKSGGIRRFPEKILKPRIPSSGLKYLGVSLCKSCTPKSIRIHRLVADAFIPNPDELKYVNHIDGNPENNDVSNLEWCTASDNLRHSYRVNGRISPMKGRTGARSHFSKPIYCETNNLIYDNAYAAAVDLNLSRRSISRVATKSRKSIHGYVFSFV